MEKRTITFEGETFIRESEMIGDTEKISWFHQTKLGDKEILTQDGLDELEDFYMLTINEQITPGLPII